MFRRTTDNLPCPSPLTTDAENANVKAGLDPTPRTSDRSWQSGKTVSSRSRSYKTAPYNRGDTPISLPDALYSASRLKLAPNGERKRRLRPRKAGSPRGEWDRLCRTGMSQLVPIQPWVSPSPCTEESVLPRMGYPDPSLPSSSIRTSGSRSGLASTSALDDLSMTHSSTTSSAYQAHSTIPQWQRIASLRVDHAGHVLSARTESLEIHARDYRVGILLLSLLDVLRDRRDHINSRVEDIQGIVQTAASLKEMGCSWEDTGIGHAHATSNELFKSVFGCEFQFEDAEPEGGLPTVEAVQNWMELKEDGESGASIPVGNNTSYPDGDHTSSLEPHIEIPIRRRDGKMGEFDIQRMGREFALMPIDVLRRLVCGVEGSQYAPFVL